MLCPDGSSSSSLSKTDTTEMSLMVHGHCEMRQIFIGTNVFVDELQAAVEKVLKVSMSRQQLFLHSPKTLVEMHPGRHLSEYHVKSGDYVTCFVKPSEWEDSDSEDEKPAVACPSKTWDARLQESLDEEKLDELTRAYDCAREKYRVTRSDALHALKRLQAHQRLLLKRKADELD